MCRLTSPETEKISEETNMRISTNTLCIQGGRVSKDSIVDAMLYVTLVKLHFFYRVSMIIAENLLVSGLQLVFKNLFSLRTMGNTLIHICSTTKKYGSKSFFTRLGNAIKKLRGPQRLPNS